MKLAARDIESFLKKAPVCLGVLVYGPDTGLVAQRAEILAKYVVEDLNDPFRVVQLESDSLKDDPARLADELNAMSFGGGRRLVRLRAEGGVGAAVAGALEAVAPGADAFLLVTADDLPATSALRKLFEADKRLVALPCYVEDARGLKPVIQQELRNKNIQFSNDVAEYLAQACQGDRLIAISEIAKLDLYLGEERGVSLEDVQSCIGSTTESTLDDICAAVAEGNQPAIERHLRRAYHQGVVPIMLLRAVQRHATRLQRVAAMVERGGSAEQAVESLRPPVFFKQKPAFTRAAARWAHPSRRQKLPQWLHILYEAELACKSSGADAELMCSRALMQAAALGGR